MATIVSHTKVEDGYETRVVLKDGRRMTWHFILNPPDLQAAVDEAEVRLKQGEIEEWKRDNSD